jgi:hypothetical protein
MASRRGARILKMRTATAGVLLAVGRESIMQLDISLNTGGIVRVKTSRAVYTGGIV